jgi:hypothetical protein
MGVSQAPHQVARWSVVAAVAVLAAGCVSMASLVPDVDAPPTGPICEVATWWNPQVEYSPDPTRNGMPIPGLVGRLYLFGENKGVSLSGEGSAVIDLFEPARADGQGSLVPVEEWRIDKDTLQRLLRRDRIGWGYTLFLPWSTYRPDFTKLMIRARFESVKGVPIYSEGSLVTLNQGMGSLAITSNQKIMTPPQAGAAIAPLPPLPQAGN